MLCSKVRKVKGKEQYRTNCTNRPLGCNSRALLPRGHKNNIARSCRRGALHRQRIIKGSILGKYNSYTK
jgi:hypothetical protein